MNASEFLDSSVVSCENVLKISKFSILKVNKLFGILEYQNLQTCTEHVCTININILLGLQNGKYEI